MQSVKHQALKEKSKSKSQATKSSEVYASFIQLYTFNTIEMVTSSVQYNV